MKRSILFKALPLGVLIGGLVITATAWQRPQGDRSGKVQQADTIPASKGKVKNIDEALRELERSEAQLERELKAVDAEKIQRDVAEALKSVDAARIKADVDKALSQIDAAKIQQQVAAAMKEVNMAKVDAELRAAMKEVNSEEIRKQIETAMKAVDAAKIEAEVKAAMASVDMAKLSADMEKLRMVDMKKLSEEMKNLQPQIESAMSNAREGIEKARADLLSYKSLVDALHKDGLINKDEEFELRYRDGQLLIDGKLQPASVTDRYKELLKDRKDFRLRQSRNGLTINRD